jgi:hypothetical protein
MYLYMLFILKLLIFSEEKKQEILPLAEARLAQLESTLIKSIAKELQGQDLYQFLRAFSPGNF